MSNAHLIISETFYSIQGEGPCVGMPAVFLRLAGCNLRCNGFSYKDPDTGEHLGCDTKKVWQKGVRKSFVDIINDWKQQGWFDALERGAHLIITGGEPLIQQKRLVEFIKLLDVTASTQVFIEVETNATITFDDCFKQRINHVNASPKLSHSGEPQDKAYIEDVLKNYISNEKSIFKFVVASEADIEEVYANFVVALKLNPARIWLMPEGGTVLDVKEKSQWLVERCKYYVLNFSPRLHIDIWNEATGV